MNEDELKKNDEILIENNHFQFEFEQKWLWWLRKSWICTSISTMKSVVSAPKPKTYPPKNLDSLPAIFNSYISDPRVKDFLFMSNPFPMFAILATYLLFVLKWGPAFMKNRKPYDLTRIMIVYNIIQIIACARLVFQVRELYLDSFGSNDLNFLVVWFAGVTARLQIQWRIQYTLRTSQFFIRRNTFVDR